MEATTNKTLSAQQQYCKLFTALVSDQAIEKDIVARVSTTPILFFFMRVGMDESLHGWLMPRPEVLKTKPFLQVLNWLIGQYVFLERNKSCIVTYLIDEGELSEYADTRSVQQTMCKPLPHGVDKKLQSIYDECFC